MKMPTKRYGKEFAWGALVGGVLGAAAALLLAPKSGRELRGDISGQFTAIADKTKQLAQTVGSQTTEWVDKAKEAGKHVVGEIKTRRDKRQEPSFETTEAVPDAEDDLLISQHI